MQGAAGARGRHGAWRPTPIRAAAAVLLAALACGDAPPPGPPHVALFTFDGLRQDHLSAFGYARETSPNVDRLAAHGLAFRDVVPTGCSTKMSLTSLFTGLDGTTHGMLAHEGALEPGIATLAEAFQRAGYATAGFAGSPWIAGKLGYDRGFEHYRDFGAHPDAEEIGAATVEHLAALAGDPRPRFLYVHFTEPHPPWTAPAPWADPEPKKVRPFGQGCGYLPSRTQLAAHGEADHARLVARYDAAILAADTQIGRILAALEPGGGLKRSVVAVGTDHGLELMDRYSYSHGYNPFDEVLRTFLVLYDGRGGLPKLDTSRIQARIFDVGPTLLARAGVPRPPSFEGFDLVGESARLPEFALARCYRSFAVRSLAWKLVGIDFPARVRNGGAAPEPGLHLFDLEADAGERRNLAREQPDVRKRLEAASAPLARLPGDGVDEIPQALDPAQADRLRALGYGE